MFDFEEITLQLASLSMNANLFPSSQTIERIKHSDWLVGFDPKQFCNLTILKFQMPNKNKNQ